MGETEYTIQQRTLDFAVRVVRFCRFLDEQGGVGRILAKQLIRSGTSIGANVREAQSAQSDRDFLHKLEIALKEAQETEYWFIILHQAEVVETKRIQSLLDESKSIIKILTAITAKLKQKAPKPNSQKAKTR